MGKVITIEGSDAVGKKTQAEMLVKTMRKEGYAVETISFPRYDTFFGKIISAYLKGHFGKATEIKAEEASMLYAFDRLFAQTQIKEWLNEGKYVILDRYMESNFGHQAAKVSRDARVDKITELHNFEVFKLGIRPSDVVVYLSLPLEFALQAMEVENRKGDMHEMDRRYQIEVHKTYEIAAEKFNWRIIECAENGRRLGIEEVATRVWDVVKREL